MNKEQSADDPSVDLIRVKNMLNSTRLFRRDSVVNCMYRTFRIALEAFRAIEAALVKHDNNMIIPWWLTDHITANR